MFMSITITGIVINGVVVPSSPLPEGEQVEIHLKPSRPEQTFGAGPRIAPGELRKMSRQDRQAILAAAAELAEQDYRDDKELTGFEAFAEEELDDDEADAP
jgi:hypothetical protein